MIVFEVIGITVVSLLVLGCCLAFLAWCAVLIYGRLHKATVPVLSEGWDEERAVRFVLDLAERDAVRAPLRVVEALAPVVELSAYRRGPGAAA